MVEVKGPWRHGPFSLAFGLDDRACDEGHVAPQGSRRPAGEGRSDPGWTVAPWESPILVSLFESRQCRLIQLEPPMEVTKEMYDEVNEKYGTSIPLPD